MGKLALKGGEPVRKKEYPSWPVFDEKEEKAVLEVLRSGKWWYGEKVRDFEGEFATFQDAGFGITTTNGTAGLEIALICNGIGAGDEVIIPPYTFVASATAVLKVNAIPIFADIEEDTFNIDPDRIEEAITDRTKAIMPVHFGGLPCDMDRILEISRKHNLKVIEDACHSWGTKWKGKGTGALGNAGAFSFQMSKNITSGEGGIILTDSEELADQCRSYSNLGRREGKPWYKHYIASGNYRMTEIQAAILLVQLGRLEEQTVRRQENGRYLNEKISPIEGIRILREDSRVTRRSYHIYMFRYISKEFGNLPREAFLEALRAEGIPCGEGYPHSLHKNPLFHRNESSPQPSSLSCPNHGREVDYTALNLPVTEKICSREAVWLAHSMLLGSREDMEDIVRAIEKIKDNVAELL